MTRLPHPYDLAGETIRNLRVEAKKTQFEVASVLGIDGHTLYRYEAGMLRMSLGTFCRLLVFYGIPVILEPRRSGGRVRPMALDLSKVDLSKRSEAVYGIRPKKRKKA